MSGRQGRNRKKKRSNSRNHWKRKVQEDDDKTSSGTRDIKTTVTTKTADNSNHLQSLDAGKAARTLTNEEKEIAGVKNDGKVSIDKAKRVKILKAKSKDISCTINDGEICSSNIQHVGLHSITDEEKDDLYDTKECEKSLDKAEVSHLHDDLPNSLESGCRPTLERPATNGTLVCEHLKENDQSLFLKLDDSKGSYEETEKSNTYEENGAHSLSSSLELGRANRPEQTTPCAISVCVNLKENQQNQYPETDENEEKEEEVKRTNANGENISDSVPKLSESGKPNTRAELNSTVIISAREYLEEDDSNLYVETDEGEENDEEAVETIAHEEKTTDDFIPNLLQSSTALARLSGEALSETKENDIKTNADKENITYCLPKAEDSGCAQDQPTTYSISACEYLTKNDQNLFLETNESEEHEEETEDINADNTLTSFSNSLEPSNTFPHQNECVIPLCDYLEENDQNPFSETGENEANYEEIKQTNASEGNASNFFPYLLDSGSVVVQKNLTVISPSEFMEENNKNLCYVMDERRENDNENQVTHTQVHGPIESSRPNSCSDPPIETQKNDRASNAENITFCLPSAFDSRPTIDQRNTHAMSVCEYLNEGDQNVSLEMIESEETEATNSNEEMFYDCVTRLVESGNTFAQANENVSPVCRNLEENYQELYSKTEESKENDEKSGEENDEETEEAKKKENKTHGLPSSLKTGNTIDQATVCAISVQEFLKENEQKNEHENLYSQTDESEDSEEEIKGTIANQENVSDFLPNSLESDNTFAQEDSARISSAHEYLKENDRNVYVDMVERDENVDERQAMNTHEEKTTDCLCNLLKSSNAFAPQARDAISETQGNEIETNAENTTDCLPNASSSTIDQPNTYAMSVCECQSKGDQTLISEMFESKENAGETDEINANQEQIDNYLPHLSESGNTFVQQTKNMAPVCEYLEEIIDQSLYFKMEHSEENDAATEEATVSEETRAYYLSNSPELDNALDQSNTCDITACEYLKENEQNLYFETEESEDSDEEMKETSAKGENISDCLPNPSELDNIPVQQKSTALSVPEFLEDQILYFQTSESEEDDEDTHETNANDENITDCVPNSIELGHMFDQPTIDAENNENHVQTSAKEGNLSRSLQSSSELCDAFPKQSTNAISVSEYLEQKDQILFSEADESEGGEETNENMPDSLDGFLELCNNVAQHTKNVKSVTKHPEENDQMKEDEENDGQLNENEESRQMKEQNIILLPPSTNLQNELDSFSKIGDEHNNDEEMYKSDETSHDLENLACKSSSMLELALMPQTPNPFVDSSTYWNYASQQTTITEPLLLGEKLTKEFSYKTENDGIASMTENLPDKHLTVAQKSISLSDLQCYRQTCPQDRPFSADAQSDVKDTAFCNEKDRDGYGEQCEKLPVNYEYVNYTDSNLSFDNSSLKGKTLTSKTTQYLSRSPDCSNSNNQDTTVISENKFLLQTGTRNIVGLRADEENGDFEEGFGIDNKKGKTSESDLVQFSSWLKCSLPDSQPAQYSVAPQSLNSGSIIRDHSETLSPMSGIAQENNLTRISVIKSEKKEYEKEVYIGKQENQPANRISVELSCKVSSKVSRSQSLPEISQYSLCYQPSMTAAPVSTYFPQLLQETISLVNMKPQKIDKEFSEYGKKKEITDAEGCIVASANHRLMFEHSGDSVVDQTPNCLHDSPECIHRSTADASSTSEVDLQMKDDSRSSVRIPSDKVMTVAEFLLEPDPNKNSEDDDIDCDCSSNYEKANTQQETMEKKKSDRYEIDENKLFEGSQKKDVKVTGNSETDETENDDNETENLHLRKSEENIDSDQRETSYDEEEFSESLDEDTDETKSQPNRLVLKEIPDEGRNRLSQIVCELFLVLAGLLLIICTALLVIMYRQQLFCFSYVFGPPPT